MASSLLDEFAASYSELVEDAAFDREVLFRVERMKRPQGVASSTPEQAPAGNVRVAAVCWKPGNTVCTRWGRGEDLLCDCFSSPMTRVSRALLMKMTSELEASQRQFNGSGFSTLWPRGSQEITPVKLPLTGISIGF